MASNTADSGPKSETNVSRRKWLKAAAASGLGASVAGCSGQSQNQATTTSTTSEDDGGQTTTAPPEETSDVDQTYVSYVFSVPENIQYNLFNPKNTQAYPNEVLFVGPTILNNGVNKRVPLLFEDWSLDGKTFTITVSDKFTWHDGSDVTAKDVVSSFRLKDLMGEIKQEITKVESSGREVTITLKEEGNPDITTANLVDINKILPHKKYSQFIDRLDKASSEEDRNQIQEDLSSYTIEEPIGCGPFEFESANARELTLTRFDDYPWEYVQKSHSETTGDDITEWPNGPNFKTLKFTYTPDHNKVAQAIKAKKVDGGPGVEMLSSENASLPSPYSVLESPSYWGIGFHYNLWEEGDDAWKDPNVRKALAHIIDQQAVGKQKNAKEAKLASSHPFHGLPGDVAEEWLSDDFRNSLKKYDQDFGKAEELLKESGYEKKDDKWHKPNGDRLKVSFKTGACVTHYTSMIQVANANLKRFGIKTELEALDCTSFFGKSYKARDYELTTPGFWGGYGPHPWFGFQFVYNYSPEEYLGAVGPTLKAPPVGKPDSDERIEVDVYKLLDELATNIPKERQKEITRKLAWVTNWNAIKIPTNRQINTALGPPRNRWQYPKTDATSISVAAFNCGVYWMFHAGLCQAKQK